MPEEPSLNRLNQDGDTDKPEIYQIPKLPLWLAALASAIATIIPYLQTIQFDFIWDDNLLLVEWPFYRSPELFAQALWRNVPFSPNYFRPTGAVSFLANNVAHGLEPLGYHVFNVGLHALTTVTFAWLVYRILARMSSDDAFATQAGHSQPHVYSWLALILAILFAWHPVHVEAVAFISSRFDLLSALFVLLALAFALFVRPRWLAAISTGLAFLLALGAKEMAVTMPFLLFAIDRAYNSESSAYQSLRRQSLNYLSLAIAGGVYLVVRYASLGYLYLPSGDALPTENLLQHILLIALSSMRYLLLMIWPFGTLSPIQFAMLPISADDVTTWAALMVGFTLLIGLIWTVRKQKRWAWLWVAFLISLLPVLNIIPLDLRGGSIIAERFLYLPSAFFILAVGATLLPLIVRATTWAFASPVSWKPVVFSLVLLPMAAYLLITFQTTAFWRDNESLWQWAWKTAPQSSLPPTNLAFSALARNDGSRALQWATLATRLDPENSTAQNNVGAAHMLLGQPGEAADAYQMAASQRPENLRYWENLASALLESREYQRAVRVIEDEWLPRNENSGIAYQMLGHAYLQLGDPDPALEALRAAENLVADPAILQNDMIVALAASGRGKELFDYLDQAELSADGWARLGDMLFSAGDLEHALIAYEHAQNPSENASGQLDGASLLRVQLQKGEIYLHLGDLAGAERITFGIIATKPNEPRAHKLMGDILQRKGTLSAAVNAYQRAEKLAPNTPAITFALAEVYAEADMPDEAIDYFAKTAELVPGFAEVHFRWGELLWQQGEKATAREHFERYLELAPSGSHAEEAHDYLSP